MQRAVSVLARAAPQLMARATAAGARAMAYAPAAARGGYSRPAQSAGSSSSLRSTGYRFACPEGRLELRMVHPKFRSVPNSRLISPANEGSIYVSVFTLDSSAAAGDASGKPRYNYEGAPSVYLNAADIITLVNSGAQPVSISHTSTSTATGKPVTRKLELTPPAAAGAAASGDKPRAPVYTLTVTTDGTSAAVTMDHAEFFLLRNMLVVAVPWVTGWQQSLDPRSISPALHLLQDAAAPGAGGEAGAGPGAEAAAAPEGADVGAAPAAAGGYSRGGYGGGGYGGGGYSGGGARGSYGGGYNRGGAAGEGGAAPAARPSGGYSKAGYGGGGAGGGGYGGGYNKGSYGGGGAGGGARPAFGGGAGGGGSGGGYSRGSYGGGGGGYNRGS